MNAGFIYVKCKIQFWREMNLPVCKISLSAWLGLSNEELRSFGMVVADMGIH